MQTKKSIIDQNIFHYNPIVQVLHQKNITEGQSVNNLKSNKFGHLRTNNYKN